MPSSNYSLSSLVLPGPLLREATDASGFLFRQLTSGLVDWGTVLGQDFSLPTVVAHTGFEITSDSALGSDPIVSANISSFYGPDTANLRLVDVTADSYAATAEFRVKEESSLDGEQWHVLEDLNGLAFSGAGILQGEAIVDDFLIA